MSRKILLAVVFCATGLLSVGPSLCQAGKPSTAVRKIERVLDSEVRGFDFPVPTPLSDVVLAIRKNHGIEVKIDNRALEDVAMTSDVECVVQLQGITLRSALQLVLSDLDLTYLVHDEVLLITTPERATMYMTTKVYPFADLMPHPATRTQEPLDDMQSHVLEAFGILGPPWVEMPRGGGAVLQLGAPGGEVLVVRQTYHMHRDIAALLKDVRKTIKSQHRRRQAAGSSDARPDRPKHRRDRARAGKDEPPMDEPPMDEKEPDEPLNDDPFAR